MATKKTVKKRKTVRRRPSAPVTKKKKVTKKTVKKVVSRKKVSKTAVSKKTVSAKRKLSKPSLKSLEEMVDTAQQEKDLYQDIPSKYKKKIRNLVKECKNRGYVTSDVLLDSVSLDECDHTPDMWECIGKILSHHCVDVVEESGLLKEIELETDPRFPELDPSSYDSIQVYLRDIGKYPLLSAEEEQNLGKKIIARQDILSKKSRKKLTPSERKKILREGVEARHKLAVANLRLVVSIAKNYAGRNRSRDLSLLDLVQEGAEGLYRAVDKFEPNRGFKFSTYATWWIKQAIVRGLADKSRTIRIPVHMSETAQKYQKTVVWLERMLGRTPTVQEIAEELEVEPEKIHMIRRVSQDIVQLEQTIGAGDEGGNTTISDTIEDQDQETQEAIVSQDILKNQVQNILKDLTPRERQVIELRHGMEDGVQYTLEQIGNMLGVTRERVRQIEARALEKMRAHQLMKKLENY